MVNWFRRKLWYLWRRIRYFGNWLSGMACYAPGAIPYKWTTQPEHDRRFAAWYERTRCKEGDHDWEVKATNPDCRLGAFETPALFECRRCGLRKRGGVPSKPSKEDAWLSGQSDDPPWGKAGPRELPSVWEEPT
jgi:hypothetical protein